MTERVKQIYSQLTYFRQRPMAGAQFPDTLTLTLRSPRSPHLPESWQNVALAPPDG